MTCVFRNILLGVCLAPLLPEPSIGQPRPLTDEAVDELVDHLVGILKERHQTEAVMSVSGEIWLTATGERIKVRDVYRGKVISESKDAVVFETTGGMRFRVGRQHILYFNAAGHFRGEMFRLHAEGGVTALATLALIAAGESRYDPVVSSALDFLEGHSMPGTYGRALRASIYSHLVQRAPNEEEKDKYYRLLRRDGAWLMHALHEKGGYTYHQRGEQERDSARDWTFDNSNSQFGALGAWISALAGYDVPDHYWQRTEKFWLELQEEDGGWGYKPHGSSSENMTIAGINSLIIVLDQLYARARGRYEKFKGIEQSGRNLGKITILRQAIARALHWLALNGRPFGEGYTQLGTERLGLASGEKYLGNRDWYRAGARGAIKLKHWDRRKTQDVAMWLIFLSYGRAPVLVNKLKWGAQDSGWDYYYRDMYHVCRFLSNTYEKIYKWQIIDEQASLDDLQDAPFLYISGQSEFTVPQYTRASIKSFIDQGGTVIGHANLRNARFISSFRSFFEALYGRRRFEFRKLSFDHPLYDLAFGGERTPFRIRVPIWALSDGYREAVLLFPVDIAGAWHKSLEEEYIDFFRLMANIRLYAAGDYDDLPGRLRGERFATPAAAPVGFFRVARAVTPADRGGAPDVWSRMGRLMEHYYGLTLKVNEDVALSDINPSFDLVHVAGQGEYQFTDDELEAMKAFCAGGGLVLIEALGGNADFVRSIRPQLEAIYGKAFERLDPKHDLFQGKYERGRALADIRYLPDAVRIGRKLKAPLLYGVQTNGRLRMLFSPMDLSVSAAGQSVYGTKGYEIHSARRILRNILLYQFSRIAKRPWRKRKR